MYKPSSATTTTTTSTTPPSILSVQHVSLCCIEEERSDSPALPNARPKSMTGIRPMDPLLIPVGAPAPSASRRSSIRSEDTRALGQLFDGAGGGGLVQTPHNASQNLKLPRSKSLQLLRRRLSHGISKSMSNLQRAVSRREAEHGELEGTPEATTASGPVGAILKSHRLDVHVETAEGQPRIHLLGESASEQGDYDEDATEISHDLEPQILHPRAATALGPAQGGEWSANGLREPVIDALALYKEPAESEKRPLGCSDDSGRASQQGVEQACPSIVRDEASSLVDDLRRLLVGLLPDLHHNHHSLVSHPRPRPPPAPAHVPRLTRSASLYGLHSGHPWASDPEPRASQGLLSLAGRASRSEPALLAHLTSTCNTNSSIHQEPNVRRERSHSQPGRLSGTDNGLSSKDAHCTDKGMQIASTSSSIHLYNMRISQALRSTSPLSLTERTGPVRLQHTRTISDGHGSTHPTKTRRDRQNSSSAFGSANVPATWGNVISSPASSVYSSRPVSPEEEGYHQYGIDTIAFLRDFGAGITSPFHPISLDGVANAEIPTTASPLEDIPSPEHPAIDTQDTAVIHPNAVSDNLDDPSRTMAARHKVQEPRLDETTTSSISSLRKYEEKLDFRSSKKTRRKRGLLHFFRERVCHKSKGESPPTSTDIPESPRKVEEIKEVKEVAHTVDVPTDEAEAEEEEEDPAQAWESALRAQQWEQSGKFPSTGAIKGQGPSWEYRGRTRQHSVQLGPLDEDPGEYAAERESHKGPAQLRINSSKSPNAIAKAIDSPLQPERSSWSRFPSHSRSDRSGSAGKEDKVMTRDFAFDPEISDTPRPSSQMSAGTISLTRASTKGSNQWFKKGNPKRRSTPHKANGLLKNYSTMFRSQSMEFFRWGHGHRSSISVGGTLKYPELEVLPSIWTTESDPSSSTPYYYSALDGQAVEMVPIASRTSSNATVKTIPDLRHPGIPPLAVPSWRNYIAGKDSRNASFSGRVPSISSQFSAGQQPFVPDNGSTTPRISASDNASWANSWGSPNPQPSIPESPVIKISASDFDDPPTPSASSSSRIGSFSGGLSTSSTQNSRRQSTHIHADSVVSLQRAGSLRAGTADLLTKLKETQTKERDRLLKKASSVQDA